VVHRAIYRLTPGKFGLWSPEEKRWGAMRLKILGYIEDGPNLVTVAMNGWAPPEPAWWLNLQASPDATVELADGFRAVRGRPAEDEEADRLWARWRAIDANVDGFRELRSSETALVVLEPRTR
jgi:deazaflavin-dependent oxidoreductase (nitroreductase family)